MTIKSAGNIQKTIQIPTRFSDAQVELIGELMIKAVVKRTKKGLDVNGKSFKYKKGSEFKGNNLYDSGDMLSELEVVDSGNGFITIGYSDTASIEANQAEGQQIGASNPDLAKPFIGINEDELDLIIATFESETTADDLVSEAASSGAASFLNNLFQKQGL